MICWTCILKQRLKLDKMDCPACKEPSRQVLISDDPNDTVGVWQKNRIEDPDTGLVYAN